MKTHASPSLTLAHAFEQFLAVSSFARRTCESYAEDLAPLLAECGQKPVTALTADIVQAFLVRQESLAPATFNRRLAALPDGFAHRDGRPLRSWMVSNGNQRGNGRLVHWTRSRSSLSCGK